MSVLPFLFIRQMEEKYAIKLKGDRATVLWEPRFQIHQASFVWRDRVELIQGDFQIEINPLLWLKSRIWSISLKGDGATLRFLGDWLKKTGVDEVKTERLRLELDFFQGEIHEIHLVEVVSPDYQFQIKSRAVS